MAITGGGTSSNPYICHSFSELKTAFTKGLGASDQAHAHVYIKMDPDAEDKVMDLRRSGFYSGYVIDAKIDRYYHFDACGWTILGFSCVDGGTYLFSERTSNTDSVEIKNLTIKNFYISSTGNNNNSSAISYYSGGYNNKIIFRNCKFSGVLDGSGTGFASMFEGVNGYESAKCYSCSFNIKYVGIKCACTGYGAYYHWVGTVLYNCLFNITGTGNIEHYCSKTESTYIGAYALLYNCTAYFCKASFNIQYRKDIYGSSDQKTIELFSFSSNSLYNFVDMALDVDVDMSITTINGNSVNKLLFSINNVNNVNISYPKGNDNILFIPWDKRNDKDYLNNCGFLVGDVPTD